MEPARETKPSLGPNDLIRLEFISLGIHKIPIVCDPLMADDLLIFTVSGKNGIIRQSIRVKDLFKNAEFY